MEKVNEHSLLFGVEVGAVRQHLAIIVVGVEWDLLCAFFGLEAAYLVFWLKGLSGEGLDPRGELSGALDYLPLLDALDVAFIGVLVRGADCWVF